MKCLILPEHQELKNDLQQNQNHSPEIDLDFVRVKNKVSDPVPTSNKFAELEHMDADDNLEDRTDDEQPIVWGTHKDTWTKSTNSWSSTLP